MTDLFTVTPHGNGIVSLCIATDAERHLDSVWLERFLAALTGFGETPSVRAVVLDGGLLKAARKETIHIGCSTISVGFAEELAEAHRQAEHARTQITPAAR